jgi:hypothetical protein
MTKKQQTILLAVLGVAGIVLIAVVVVAVWVVTSLVENQPMNETAATKAFDEVRARFPDATPVVDLRADGPVLLRRPPETKPAGELKTLHIMRWDVHEENMSRVDLPFALLRMRDGLFTVQTDRDGSGIRIPMSLRVSDIERFGPTLLMDDTLPDGGRVLIWSE